ncbi:MAG TPA: hypothetical protein PK624_01190 [Spirochaetota bacterium]|nr:hypothetical protein [Spirochaetota bacterium]HOR43392.1 hypothetical protein [Spirochaetota bacterium]HPK56345.1 hypothetical protein [Spirochaetota bacterium]
MKKKLIIIFIFISGFSLCGSAKNENEEAIKHRVYRFIDAIIAGNTILIIEMLSDKYISVDDDLSMSKSEIGNEFKKKSWLYFRLLDGENYQKYLKSMGALSHKSTSIRDDLIELKSKRMRIKFVGFSDDQKNLAYTVLTWEGEEKSRNTYRFSLVLEKNDWKIDSLIIRSE